MPADKREQVFGPGDTKPDIEIPQAYTDRMSAIPHALALLPEQRDRRIGFDLMADDVRQPPGAAKWSSEARLARSVRRGQAGTRFGWQRWRSGISACYRAGRGKQWFTVSLLW